MTEIKASVSKRVEAIPFVPAATRRPQRWASTDFFEYEYEYEYWPPEYEYEYEYRPTEYEYEYEYEYSRIET